MTSEIAREALQAAWDRIDSLPPIDFTQSEAEAILAALASPIPAGRKLVPEVPTREMWAAGGNAIVGYKQRHHDKVTADVWAGMLAAAPSPGDDA